MIDLDMLDQLAQAATPGKREWEGDALSSELCSYALLYAEQSVSNTNYDNDRALIAACDPDTVRPLVAVVKGQAMMLRRLEWSDVRVPRRGVRIEQCPICDKQKDGGHAPDCELAALLAALPGAAEEGE